MLFSECIAIIVASNIYTTAMMVPLKNQHLSPFKSIYIDIFIRYHQKAASFTTCFLSFPLCVISWYQRWAFEQDWCGHLRPLFSLENPRYETLVEKFKEPPSCRTCLNRNVQFIVTGSLERVWMETSSSHPRLTAGVRGTALGLGAFSCFSPSYSSLSACLWFRIAPIFSF